MSHISGVSIQGVCFLKDLQLHKSQDLFWGGNFLLRRLVAHEFEKFDSYCSSRDWG